MMTAFLETMDCMAVGARGLVRSLGEETAMTQRLRDLGLVEGTTVRCVLKSPAGSPAAYEIRGAWIALRRGDARRVTVEALR